MKLLSGRFPHLVEGILGLLDGKTLLQCSQVNKTWNEDLENHRLHLVRKSQKHLLIPTIVYDKVYPNSENHPKNWEKNHQKNVQKNRQQNRQKNRQKSHQKNHQKNHQKLVKKSLGTNNLNINDNADFDKEEKNSSPEILFKSMTTMEHGSWSPARLCKIEKLPLPILDHFLMYFDNYKLKECQVNFETMWETKSLVCWSPQSATVQDFTGAW